VDDDSSIRRSLSRLLRLAGFDVKALASAGELLACEWPARPACLVIDIHLPDINGLVLLQEPSIDSQIPVIVLTGDPDPELRTQALQQGAAAFLNKPFDNEQLLQAIRCALIR